MVSKGTVIIKEDGSMKGQILAGLMLIASQVGWAQTATPAPAPAPAPSPAPTGFQLHNKFILQVPYGASYFDYRLAKPTTMNPIRVLFTLNSACPTVPMTAVSVNYEGTAGW